MVIWHTCLMVMCHLMVTWRVFRVVGSSETSWSFSSVRRVTAWYSQGKRMNSDGVSSSNWDWPAGLHDNGHVRVLILLMDLDLDPDQSNQITPFWNNRPWCHTWHHLWLPANSFENKLFFMIIFVSRGRSHCPPEPLKRLWDILDKVVRHWSSVSDSCYMKHLNLRLFVCLFFVVSV